MRNTLTREELDIWRGFRFMVEETSLAISRALIASTGMSGGQFGILTILTASAHGSMRQQELADEMRWDRTRLSHQLTRMQARGWIIRKKAAGGVTTVLITKSGKEQLAASAPVMGKIIRERFFNRLSKPQIASLQKIRQALSSPPHVHDN